jgi:hypothetical protein
MEDKNINEARTQIKRKYAAHGSIRVNEKAPIRNKVIQFVGKRFVTEEEMKSFLTQLTEDRGKEFDQRKWFGRNEKYFEAFENRGQKVWTLSKFGKRVLENVIKKSEQKQTINESVGLFKNIRLNESRINEAFATLDMGSTFEGTLSSYEEGEDEDTDIKVMKKGFEDIAKLLKGNLKTISSTMEEGDYEFSQSLTVGLDKRVDAGDSNIERIGETTINSPFDSRNTATSVTAYLIKDAGVTCACWNYGDDFATFDHVAYLTKDSKKLLAWVNKNLTEDDMNY